MKSSVLVFTMVLVIGACTSSKPSNPKSSESQNPLYSLTLMRQGSLLLQQGRYQAALEKFEEADGVAPGNATVLNMMGLCHIRMQHFDQALFSFNRALDLVPAFTDARNNRGTTYLAMGQYRMAEVDFSAVLADSTYPHRFDVYFNLGMTYFQRGLTSAAKENFRNALNPDQPVFEAYLQLANIEQQEGATDKAVTLLEEAIMHFPTKIEAPLALGRLLINLGRETEAEPFLRSVINHEPGSDSAKQARLLLGED